MEISLVERLGRIWQWVKWPAAVAMLVFLFAQNRTAISEFAAKPKDWPLLAAAFGLVMTATLLTFVRWYLLVWALEFPFRLRDAVRLGFLGLLLTYVGAGLVGGDMFKAVFIAREQQSRRGVAAATVFLDRILGLLALLQLGALATLGLRDFPESSLHTAVYWTLWGATAGGMLGMFLLLQPRVTQWVMAWHPERWPLVGRPVGALLNSLLLYQARPRVLVLATLMGVISHAAFFTGFYCCALALGGWAPDLLTHFYFMPTAAIIGVMSPTPGGIGPLEWAIQKAYGAAAPAGVPLADAEAAGLLAAVAFRLVSMACALLGGLLFASRQNTALPADQQGDQGLERDQQSDGGSTPLVSERRDSRRAEARPSW